MTDKARILFIDDEKRVLNAMRGLFRREYELFLTCEGAEAIRMVEENDIDVIVADQRMPGMTGIEVLGKIKERSPRTVRILLTGYADPSAVEGSINVGEVFRFLSKPCPPKMLRETLALAVTAAQTAPVVRPEPKKPAPAPAPAATVRQAPPPAPAASPPPSQEPELSNTDDTEPALPVLDDSTLPSPAPEPMPGAPTQPQAHWETVTNVVMSEDSVEETVETIGLGATSTRIRQTPVVVFTIDSEFASTAIRAMSSDRNLIIATTLVKVAHAIEEQKAGVLITDFTTNGAMLQKMLGALKQRMPELVTIVVSNGRDTTDMINLINFGQIFRYVLKPIEPQRLQNDINAAVIQHLYLKSNPEAAARHEVLESPELGETNRSLNRFLGKFRKPGQSRADPADTIA